MKWSNHPRSSSGVDGGWWCRRKFASSEIIDIVEYPTAPQLNVGSSRWMLAAAQTTLFIANILSTLALFDCQLISVPVDQVETRWSGNVTIQNIELYEQNNNPRVGFGLFIWEESNGACASIFGKDDNKKDVDNTTTIHICDVYDEETYEGTWVNARYCAIVCLIVSWIMMFGLLSFCWHAYKNLVRYIMVCILIFIIPSYKMFELIIVRSLICQAKYDCQIGVDTYYNAIALPLYIVSGLLVLCIRQDPIQQQHRQQQLEQRFRRYNKYNHHHHASNSMDHVCTVDEEERRRDGFSNAREVPVDIASIDLMALTSISPNVVNNNNNNNNTSSNDDDDGNDNDRNNNENNDDGSV